MIQSFLLNDPGIFCCTQPSQNGINGHGFRFTLQSKGRGIDDLRSLHFGLGLVARRAALFLDQAPKVLVVGWKGLPINAQKPQTRSGIQLLQVSHLHLPRINRCDPNMENPNCLMLGLGRNPQAVTAHLSANAHAFPKGRQLLDATLDPFRDGAQGTCGIHLEVHPQSIDICPCM